MGVSYLWLSCWMCLFNSASSDDLTAALDVSDKEYLEYIAEFNDAHGINPAPKDLIRRRYAESPSRVCESRRTPGPR